MSDDNPLYRGGFPSLERMGFIPLRSARGAPDPGEMAKAAAAFGEPVRHVDASGYECEIIGAAVEGGGGYVAFVRSRARELREDLVDIDIRIHLLAPEGTCESWPIESYNPYFGCDVGFMQWIEGVCILVYREKHHVYAWRLAPREAPRWRKLDDNWMVRDGVLAWLPHGSESVFRLRSKDFVEMEPMPVRQALHSGWHPWLT